MLVPRGACLALIVATAGCGADAVAAPPPGMVASLTSGAVEVASGGVDLIVASVIRTGEFAGDVQFVVDGAPEGIHVEASTTQTSTGVTSALLAIAASGAVPLGDYPLTIRAIAYGVPDARATLLVTVAPAGTQGYTLEARPIAVVRGANASVNASIDRGVNTKNVSVALTAPGLPAGVSATLYPATNTAALATLTVTVGGEVTPGHYTITLRGVAAGIADRVAVIPLTVLAGP